MCPATPFRRRAFYFPPFRPLPPCYSLLVPPRRLFRGHCGSRLRHRSARSNLINSCKFNYWLTAPRLVSALYIFLAPSREHERTYLALERFYFFSSFPRCLSLALSVSFSSRLLTAVLGEPRTNPSLGALSFLRSSSPASVSRRNFAGNAIARKW